MCDVIVKPAPVSEMMRGWFFESTLKLVGGVFGIGDEHIAGKVIADPLVEGML